MLTWERTCWAECWAYSPSGHPGSPATHHRVGTAGGAGIQREAWRTGSPWRPWSFCPAAWFGADPWPCPCWCLQYRMIVKSQSSVFIFNHIAVKILVLLSIGLHPTFLKNQIRVHNYSNLKGLHIILPSIYIKEVITFFSWLFFFSISFLYLTSTAWERVWIVFRR